MSDPLKKIEKTLATLAKQQEQICERMSGIEAALQKSSPRPDPRAVLTFLDQFRAGEALGEASLGAWIEVCQTDCLRGGLRTVQARERSHALLLAERLKELGGSPSFEIPDAIYEKSMREAADCEKPDAEKVANFVAQFPDCDAALKPIHDMADSLDHDQETQFLLRSIACDERATLEFLHEACALLNPA